MRAKLNLFQAWLFRGLALGIGSSFSLAAAAEDSADTANTSQTIPWLQIGAKAGADYKGVGLAARPKCYRLFFFTRTAPLTRIHSHEDNEFQNDDAAYDGGSMAGGGNRAWPRNSRNDPGQLPFWTNRPPFAVRKPRSPLGLALARGRARVQQDLICEWNPPAMRPITRFFSGKTKIPHVRRTHLYL